MPKTPQKTDEAKPLLNHDGKPLPKHNEHPATKEQPDTPAKPKPVPKPAQKTEEAKPAPVGRGAPRPMPGKPAPTLPQKPQMPAEKQTGGEDKPKPVPKKALPLKKPTPPLEDSDDDKPPPKPPRPTVDMETLSDSDSESPRSEAFHTRSNSEAFHTRSNSEASSSSSMSSDDETPRRPPPRPPKPSAMKKDDVPKAVHFQKSGSMKGVEVSGPINVRKDTISEFKLQEDDGDESPEGKKRRKRNNIIKEIFLTEKSYVEALKNMVDLYMTPFKTTHSAMITPANVNGLFSNVEDVIKINSNFLEDLQEKMENWTDTSAIGKLFIEYVPFFKIYSIYVSNFDEATALLDKIKKDTNMDAFLKQQSKDPRSNGLDLRSYLIMPVQRIPRYRLLLEDLLKNTDEDHPDYADIKRGLESVITIANSVNEAITKNENRRKILDIQSRINTLLSVPVNLVEPHRRFIKQGVLKKVCRKAHKEYIFLMFNDLLLYGNAITESNLVIHRVINMLEIVISDVPDSETVKNAFSIASSKKSFVVVADKPEVKFDWMADIAKTKTNFVEGQKTFAYNKDVNFGSFYEKATVSAPVWQEDSSVKGCTICNVLFTLLNRRHHCRNCGKIVCDKCSKGRLALAFDPGVMSRVCTVCYDMLTSKEPEPEPEPVTSQQLPEASSSSSSDAEAIEEPPAVPKKSLPRPVPPKKAAESSSSSEEEERPPAPVPPRRERPAPPPPPRKERPSVPPPVPTRRPPVPKKPLPQPKPLPPKPPKPQQTSSSSSSSEEECNPFV